MDTMYPAATFTATRSELLGSASLLGAAEIARGVCRGADRTVSVLAVTHDRMRRIDGWLGSTGFVTHAAASAPDRRLLGSVCDRDRAQELIEEIMTSLVGERPAAAAPGATQLPALDELSPSTLPRDIDWVLIVSTSSIGQPPDRTMLAGAGGLVGGDVVSTDRAGNLCPIAPETFSATLTEMVGEPRHTVRTMRTMHDVRSGD